jgi:hypothetical protein
MYLQTTEPNEDDYDCIEDYEEAQQEYFDYLHALDCATLAEECGFDDDHLGDTP